MIGQTVFLVQRNKAVVAVLVAILLLVSVAFGVSESDRKINYIAVTGNLNDRQKSAVEQLLVIGGSQLSDIGSVKDVLENLSWINAVQVTLNWPDEIAIRVEPEKAIAYWNDNGFINSAGNVFESDYLVAGDLPQLYGPVGKEQFVMGHYQRLNQALLKSGQFIEVLRLSERGSLDFENQFGVRVSLGNVDIEQRLKRFIKVNTRIALHEGAPRVRRVDTRYPNGVAVEFDKSEQDFEIAKTY